MMTTETPANDKPHVPDAVNLGQANSAHRSKTALNVMTFWLCECFA